MILDELGRGTSTFDGVAVAGAALAALNARRATTVFVTHYHGLARRAAAERPDVVVNAHMDYAVVGGGGALAAADEAHPPPLSSLAARGNMRAAGGGAPGGGGGGGAKKERRARRCTWCEALDHTKLTCPKFAAHKAAKAAACEPAPG